jgi:hypothetical protein
LHEGSVANQLVVTTGKRHGIASSPATEAYVQWPINDTTLLREGWNTLDITLTSSSQPLQLVETEIAIQP